MANTRILLDTVELDYCTIEYPLYRGWDPVEPVVIKQLADKYDELKALPYICDLSIENTAEVGRVDGAAETTKIEGLRIVDVTKVDDEFCTVSVTDLRKDLQDRICPADANLRWYDGYLDNTRLPHLRDLVEYIAPLVDTLQDVLAEDAFADLFETEEYEIPDGESLAGMKLPAAGARVTQLLGVDPVVGADKKLRFVRRGSLLSLAIDAYNWLIGAEPSWSVEARTPRGLPRIFRFHYWERHALRLTNIEPRDTTISSPSLLELQLQLEMVFAFDGRYGPLEELLEHYGYTRYDITHDQIGAVIMTENFEGTKLEAGVTQNAREVIGIIRRDWRLLWRVKYPEQIGRRGGWDNYSFGQFETRTDKDGNAEYTGDVSGAAVRMEYTENLAQVDEGKQTQVTWDDNVVIRSVKRSSGGTLPVAPFTASWEGSTPGEIIRLTPKPDPQSQLGVWPGRMSNNREAILTVEERERMTLDDGKAFDLPYKFTHIPSPGELRFGQPDFPEFRQFPEFEINIYVVATRRMPNNHKRWWSVDIPGFENGDVEVLEPEVGEELYLLRDYVDGTIRHPAFSADGLGQPLNEDQVQRDAERRARVMKDRLGTLVGGKGVAIGTGLLDDLNHPHEAIDSIFLLIDGIYVTTQVSVGGLDSAEARDQRSRLREQLRKRDLGGKVLA